MTSFNYDLAGTGSTQNYFAGLGQSTNKVALYRIDDGAMYKLTVTSGYVNSQYGAAWTFKDSAGNEHVYFASNTGSVGVFELLLDTVTLTGSGTGTRSGTCEIVSMGTQSAQVKHNDGISCRDLPLVPFAT